MTELADRIARLAASAGAQQVRVDGVVVFACDHVTAPIGSVIEPKLAVVAQGAKRSVVGDRIFEHEAGQAVVVTVDLPITSHVTKASPAEPFLTLGIPLQPVTIAQLLVDGGPGTATAHDGLGIAVGEIDDDLLDALVRLLRLMASPRDFRVLAPGVRREIHWRLLNGPYAGLVRQIGMADSQLTIVARAIAWIRQHYDQLMRVDDLAADVGMSVSSLNRHFRAVTAMSPLQYQKRLRLQEARLRLIAAPRDVGEIGHAVGYDSLSQFSREYRRMFGAPPGEDAARLQTLATLKE